MANGIKCNEKPKQNTNNAQGSASRRVSIQSIFPNNSPVNKLNDDCLQEIFSYLSKRQLIKIERVCKRWKNVAFSVWGKETLLNFEKITEVTKNRNQLNMKQFESILVRCGKHLKTFNLDCPDDKWDHSHSKCEPDEIIRLLSKYCKNLQHLSLHCGRVTEKGIRLLENAIAANLVSFDVNVCFDMNDSIVENFLIKAPNLDILSLGGNNEISGDGLVNSERAFKKLDIRHCGEITATNLEKVFNNSPKLEYFSGERVETFKMLNDRPLREHLVELKLFATAFFEDMPENPLPFPNLRFLELRSEKSIHNEILAQFSIWFPNIESLDLTGSAYPEEDDEDEEEEEDEDEEEADEAEIMRRRERRGKILDNDGLKALCKLPKLKSLNLNELYFLNGDLLLYLALNTDGRLETVGCSLCNKLRDPGVIKFVSLCPRLTYLDVSYCQRITDEVLEGILELMPLRTCDQPLKVRITHSKYCDVREHVNKHPLLEIEEYGELDKAFFDYSEDDCSLSDSEFEYKYCCGIR